jgi:glycosidase
MVDRMSGQVSPATLNEHTQRRSRVVSLAALAGAACVSMLTPSPALAQGEDPSAMLQWFECRWSDMERRMSDYFVAGYGSVWLPPVSRGYQNPRAANQNSFSAGYDTFDRFDLGAPGRQTAYGTETMFDYVVSEFHRAGTLVYVDMVLNHNAGRQTSLQFQQDGGYPGFYMGPLSGTNGKQPTDNWGDFHAGTAGGYYQSENPNNPRYCLLQGDLVALVDINHATVNNFIRQPIDSTNPQNIPGGTYFNRPDPNNRRFYPDQALGTDTVNNPGMWFAGELNTGIFASPCQVPARNEPATQWQVGRFNLADPMAGDPVAENATGYLLRWTQWMLDVKKVDGFRIDAIKHMPSWFYDTFYDTWVHQRRTTPDGRRVTPYSFGESVEGNSFTFDRYIRMPNGRTTGRNTAGDAFGNRDALDLPGSGTLRNIIGGGGTTPFTGFLGQQLDATDDGFNNGTIGMNHIFSHDNGTTGDGNSAPPDPTARQQGWYMHAYLAMRPGQRKFYHNARGILRTGGFWPRQGIPVALGVNPVNNVPDNVITNLIALSNQLGRGEFTPRWEDANTFVFERRNGTGGGAYSGNVLVAINNRYDAGFDSRTVTTSFPAGTRLIEMTGNATSNVVDPNNDLFDVITVGAGGQVTLRVPRNLAPSTNTEHNRGFVVYAPAIPSGTLTIEGSTTSLPSEGTSVLRWRRRLNAVPIVTSDSFTINLTTVNGDTGAGNNNNADDNAVFRLNEGFRDWNGNNITDIDWQNAVVPGYEQFVTQRQPLANTTNTNGIYRQTIDATQLSEGMNYLSVVAFRKRDSVEGPLFRDFRTALYVDRLPPQLSIVNPGTLPAGTTSFVFRAKALDRTSARMHMIVNPADLSNPGSLANATNQATQDDRLDFSRTLSGLQPGRNTILVIAVEESGKTNWQTIEVIVGSACNDIDFNNDGLFPDDADLVDFLSVLAGGPCSTGTSCDNIDFNGDGLFPDDADLIAFLRVLAGGNCEE